MPTWTTESNQHNAKREVGENKTQIWKEVEKQNEIQKKFTKLKGGERGSISQIEEGQDQEMSLKTENTSICIFISLRLTWWLDCCSKNVYIIFRMKFSLSIKNVRTVLLLNTP